MRTEGEIFHHVQEYVKQDDRVRMLLLNGSRVNSKVLTDKFSDYDFMLLVDNPIEFWQNKRWVQVFGEVIISRSCNWSQQDRERYFFLTIYKDYVRIDIQIFNITQLNYCIKKSSLTKVIIDKDNLAPELDPPSDKSHYVKQPTNEEFQEVITDFFGFTTCVVKSLHRKELPQVRYYFDYLIHQNCIIKLLSWYVGVMNDWNVNVGSNGRWLEEYLPLDLWKRYTVIFAGKEYDGIWMSLWVAIELVEEIGELLSNRMDYIYPCRMIKDIKNFVNKVQNQELADL